jgi:hypothetical protein
MILLSGMPHLAATAGQPRRGTAGQWQTANTATHQTWAATTAARITKTCGQGLLRSHRVKLTGPRAAGLHIAVHVQWFAPYGREPRLVMARQSRRAVIMPDLQEPHRGDVIAPCVEIEVAPIAVAAQAFFVVSMRVRGEMDAPRFQGC